VDIAGDAFVFVGQTASRVRLQVRAGVYGYYGDWSSGLPVAITAGATAPIPIVGTAGDDSITPGAGDHRIDGGPGIDTVIYVGPVAGSRVRRTGSTYRLSPSGDSARDDELIAVERVRFADATLELQADPPTASPALARDDGFLFDAVFYRLAHLGQVPGDSTGARQHYLATGAAQGWAPAPWFDATYYGNRWPDLRALSLDAATLFRHFNLYGVWEGRSPGPAFDRFDGTRYLRDNPDVAAYVDSHLADFLGSRDNGAIAHFLIFGANEGRSAFDASGNAVGRQFDLRLGAF